MLLRCVLVPLAASACRIAQVSGPSCVIDSKELSFRIAGNHAIALFINL